MGKPWKVILAFLGVFVAGAVFGGFFSLGVGRRIWEIEAPLVAKPTAVPAATPPAASPATPQRKSSPGVPQSVQSAQLMRRVAGQLELTPEQKAKVTPIIQRSVQDIWRQQQNLYRETTYITQRMKQEIAAELTPEQQERLDELWTKAIEQFRKRQAEALAQRQAEGRVGGRKNALPAAPAASDKPASAEENKAVVPEVKAQPTSPTKPSGDGK